MKESHSSRLSAWQQWADRCQLSKCDDKTVSELDGFVAVRFRYVLKKLGEQARAAVCTNPWHRFETHLVIRKAPGGKHWKKWLFARGTHTTREEQLACVESGVALVMRDVVRDFLFRECPRPDNLSLDAPQNRHSESTLLDMLASESDVVNDIALREYHSLAREYAMDVFPAMDPVVKVGLVARQLNIPLSHPQVLAAAGCGKSTLSERLRRFMSQLGQQCRRQYSDDPEESVLTLTMMIIQELGQLSARAGVLTLERAAG